MRVTIGYLASVATAAGTGMLVADLPTACSTHLAETTMRMSLPETSSLRRTAIGLLGSGVLLAVACPLFAAKKEPVAAGLNVPPSGFVALFNGKDLTGWKGLVLNPRSRPTLTAAEWPERQKKADE